MVNPQKIEKTFCYKTFGKSFRELNEQEKKEFYRLQKAKNRAELPELKEKESEYQKNYRSNNRERLNTKQRNNYHNNVGRYRQYGNYCRIKKRGYVEPHAQSLTRQMFGVGYKDMTAEQKRIYNTERHKRWTNNKENKGVIYERNII